MGRNQSCQWGNKDLSDDPSAWDWYEPKVLK